MKTRIIILKNKDLKLDIYDDERLKASFNEGKNTILVITRIWPDRENTFDTGLIEDLYLEFAEWPKAGIAYNAREILDKAFYTFGNIIRIYQSAFFKGQITLTHNALDKEIAGSCELEFSSPFLDRRNSGTLPVRMNFDTRQDETIYWGDSETCGYCGLQIRLSALFCPHCGKKVRFE